MTKEDIEVIQDLIFKCDQLRGYVLESTKTDRVMELPEITAAWELVLKYESLNRH